IQDNNGWAFLDENGVWVQNGWVKDNTGWCYIKDGYWLNHAGYVQDSKGWQFIGANGYWDSTVQPSEQNPLQAAENAVTEAEASRLTGDIDEAYDRVNALSSTLLEKSDFKVRLQKIQALVFDNTFDYSNIKSLMLKYNTTVQTNQNTLDKLFANYTSLEDAIDKANSSISSMSKAIAQMKAAYPTYTPLEPGTDEVDTINDILSNLDAINAKNIQSLSGTISSLQSQITTMERQQEDIQTSIDKMGIQIKMANAQINSSAEKLILSYKELNIEKKKLDANLDTLQRNLEMTIVYKEQGLATDSDVNNIKISIESLKNNIRSIERQKENIICQLNLMIGEDYTDTAEVIFKPSMLDSFNLSSIDRESDMDTAIENNYNVKLQEYEITSCKAAVSRAEEDDDAGGVQAAMLDYNNALIKYDDTIRSEKLKINKAYEALDDSGKTYDLETNKLKQEQVNLDKAKLNYSLGAISKKALSDQENTFKLQQLAVETAKYNLFDSYRQYQWIINGLSN
ncbi:MAG: hypothetical protein ACM3X7_04425, partial [Solirubrobacterales bacterium]